MDTTQWDHHWETPGEIRFPHQSVHLWLGDLNQLASYRELYKQTLPPDEWKKLNHSPIEKVRENRVTSRGLLRLLLGSYVKKEPKALEFNKSEHGKPFLVQAKEEKRLYFNLTHSQNLILFAISDFPCIGIDCESFDGHRKRKWSSLAERVFTGVEQQQLKVLPDAQKEKAFYRVWTRKEAYTKAIGDGFQYGFQNFSVPLDANVEPRITTDQKNPKASEEWQLFDISIGESAMASLCLKKPDKTPGFCYYHFETIEPFLSME